MTLSLKYYLFNKGLNYNNSLFFISNSNKGHFKKITYFSVWDGCN